MTTALTLLALAQHYEALTRVTQALVDAVERDDIEALDALVNERATLLDEAEQHLTAATAGPPPAATATRPGSTTGIASSASSSGPSAHPAASDPARSEATARLSAAARSLEESDARLRTVMAARAGELPAQLAELRGSRSGLSGYQASVLGPSTSVDRSG